jgi:hypothetical protein
MARFRYLLMTVAALGLLAPPAWGEVWDTGTYEVSPAAGAPVSEGDDRIRENKKEIRYRAEVEHYWGDLGVADDNGLHMQGSARCFMSNTAPSILTNGAADFDNSIGGSVSGVPDLDDPASNSAAGARDDVGDGRCWIDLDGPDNVAGNGDDNKLMVYVGVAGAAGCPGGGAATDCWTAASATSDVAVPDVDVVQVGSYNLLYNGSFAMNNAGVTTVPDEWTNVNTAQISYATTPASEGDGQYVAVTELDDVSDRRITQTLDELKASTTYSIIARAREIAGACVIVTTGGSDNAAIALSGASFDTYTDTFTTTAAAADIVLSMGTSATSGASDDCDFDHVAVYEQNAGGVTQHGTAIYQTCNSDVDTGWTTVLANFATNITARVVPELPNSIIEVHGHATFEGYESNSAMILAIDENGTPVQECAGSGATEGSKDTPLFCSLYYVNIDPTPGTALVYTLQAAEPEITNGDIRFPFNDTDTIYVETALGACLTVKLTAPR